MVTVNDRVMFDAFVEAIQKWEGIVYRRETDGVSVDCPFCRLFIDDDCSGCPAHESIGLSCCDGTPYSGWRTYHKRTGFRLFVFDVVSWRLAKIELNFLRGLFRGFVETLRYNNAGIPDRGLVRAGYKHPETFWYPTADQYSFGGERYIGFDLAAGDDYSIFLGELPPPSEIHDDQTDPGEVGCVKRFKPEDF